MKFYVKTSLYTDMEVGGNESELLKRNVGGEINCKISSGMRLPWTMEATIFMEVADENEVGIG